MNLKNLYNLQRDLDQKISDTHNIINDDVIHHKILALQVEVGELANETRCFKFWSLKGASSKNIILEEFVDCLHFILSIGISLNFDDINVDEIPSKNENFHLTQGFLNFFDSISLFNNVMSKENYINMFSSFLSLGKQLEFTFEDINQSYINKNNINHQRQADGY